MRVALALAALLDLALAALLVVERSTLGFPDGYLTELDRARAMVWPALGLLLAVVGLVSAASAHRPTPRRLAACLVATFLLVGGVAAFEIVAPRHLGHGQGG